MTESTRTIGERLQEILFQHGAISIEEAASGELYRALSYYVRETLGKQLWLTDSEMGRHRIIVYLSMEHLPGLMLQKNLDYLGIYDEIEMTLKEHGRELEELLTEDRELGLGSSDMGHLANGLLDTFASCGYSAIGYGLLYREGYFRQGLKEGEQTEEPDNWWSRGKNWLYKSTIALKTIMGGSVDISKEGDDLIFTQRGGEEHTIRYYDLPYSGWGNDRALRLRLMEDDILTKRLIPVNSLPEKNRQRFKQEYLLVSGAMQDIVREHLEEGNPIDLLDEHYLFLMMDSHLLLAIPELLRILLDDVKLSWDEAWDITSRAFYYTPIASIEEAMNKLEGAMTRELLPRLWLILEEIHHRYLAKLSVAIPLKEESRRASGILWDNEIRLINIAKAGAYQGPPLGHPLAVSHRRWLLSANPKLRDLLLESLGDGFISNPWELKKLSEFKEDRAFLDSLESVKRENKKRLAKTIFDTKGVLIDPYALFDGHIRDINDDNRQLLQVLWAIDQYLRLKDEPNLDVVPRVIFIGGRAASHDRTSKLLIKLINQLSDKINKDITIKDKLKLIFIEDLSQRRGEILIPAIEMVQSLTVPSKGGLNLGGLTAMVNGALALGSRDDTNMLVQSYSGKECIRIFGSTKEEAQLHYDIRDSKPQEQYYRNKELKRACEVLLGRESLVDGSLYRTLNEGLIKYNDHSLVLRDYAEYARGMKDVSGWYLDRYGWSRRMLGSIALLADFSSDTVVGIYAKKMWQELS